MACAVTALTTPILLDWTRIARCTECTGRPRDRRVHAVAYGMGLVPYSPVDGGMLAGAVEKERSGRRGGEWVTNRLERDRARIAAYEELCRRIGHAPAQVALAWLLQRPSVTAPIVGPRTISQLEDAVAAIEIQLDPETLAALDRIFPGPGGAAPEAYAW
jgi:aryl-alcohol dehydrogenase-like predicted oxidoreductase